MKLYGYIVNIVYILYLIEVQTESRYIEWRMNEINFLISLAWVEGGIDVGDLMLREL